MENSSFYVILESDIILNKKISDSELRIYSVISNFSNNKNGYCYLTYSKICDLLKISKRQFIRCVNNLVLNNYIGKVKKNNRVYLMPVINKTISDRKYKAEIDDIDFIDFDWLNDKEEK